MKTEHLVQLEEALKGLSLVWGTPGHIDMSSDGGGYYSSTFTLTDRGVQAVLEALTAEFDITPKPKKIRSVQEYLESYGEDHWEDT